MKKNMTKKELEEYKAFREARKFSREQSKKFKKKKEKVYIRKRK